MIEQYHLKGRRMSGRAIRVKPLPPSDAEDTLLAAAKACGKEAEFVEIKKTEWRLGIQQMIVEVSEPCDDPQKAKWKKVTAQDLECLGDYFTTKDMKVIEDIYREYHEVSPKEIEEIVGKAVPLSDG